MEQFLSPIPFTKDDGTACSISFGGASHAGVCNGGYEAFAINIYNGPKGLYVGRNGTFTVLDGGSSFIQPFYLNGSGDVGFTDIANDQSFQAYNTPSSAPEPGSWVLMLTGVGAAFAAQQRLFA